VDASWLSSLWDLLKQWGFPMQNQPKQNQISSTLQQNPKGTWNNAINYPQYYGPALPYGKEQSLPYREENQSNTAVPSYTGIMDIFKKFQSLQPKMPAGTGATQPWTLSKLLWSENLNE